MSGKPRLAMYWAASCGGCDVAVINLHEQDPRRRGRRRDRLLARCHGRQVPRRRGDARRLHRRVSLLGRDPQQRERGDGPSPAPQVEGAGRVRFVRQRGLHPRAGEPVHAARDLRRVVRRRREHGQPRRRPSAHDVGGARGRAPHPCPPAGPAHAGPGRAGRLLDPGLPAGVAADRRGAHGAPRRAHRHRPAAAGRQHRGRRRLHRLRRVRPDAQREEDRPLRAGPGGAGLRPDALPPGAGDSLQRARNPRWLRCPVPGGGSPVHRLLRGSGRGRRLRVAPAVGLRLGGRRRRARRDRPDPRRDRGPGRPAVSLQPGRLAAEGEPGDARGRPARPDGRARSHGVRCAPDASATTGVSPEPALAGAPGR